MDLATCALITLIEDEIKPVSKNRGARYWSTVEIKSERWFQVETCSETDGIKTLKSSFANNFEAVRQLVYRFAANKWTSVRLYTRLPLRAVDGYVFEIIKEVFELDGYYYYLLNSGLMLRDDTRNGETVHLRQLSDAKTVYSANYK